MKIIFLYPLSFLIYLAGFICLTGFFSATSFASIQPESCPSPAAFNALPAPDETQKVWIASSVYHAIKSQFGHQADLPANYDMEATFRRFIEESHKARTRLDFDKSLWVFFASLRNGHTRFYDDFALVSPPLPFI